MVFEFVLFLKGQDSGKLFGYSYIGGGAGLSGEIGASFFEANFNKESSKMDLKSAKGYTGNFNGFVGGYENNKHELWKGMYSTTTWTVKSINYSPAGGGFGANLYWGKSTIMNNGKPLLNISK
mgnify:CR=1 FL=1